MEQAQQPGSGSKVLMAIVAFVGLVAVAGGGYLVWSEYRRRNVSSLTKTEVKEDAPTKSPMVEASNWVTETVTQIMPSSVFPLKNGSKGLEVSALQAYLNKRYNAGLAPDGIWGPKTQAALQKFEQTTMWSTGDYARMQTWLAGPAVTAAKASPVGSGGANNVMVNGWIS